MQPAVLIRLRPVGPWRFGAGEGGEHKLDPVFRSDRVFSAVTLALGQLGFLEEWLDATARSSSPAATFSSLFPFQADTLFAPPPATLWPPPASLLTSPSPVFLSKMRWKAVQFIPLNLVEALVTGQQVLADQWVIDAESGCLLRRDRPSQSPFRFASRPRAAVDRVTATSQQADQSACVEFETGSGLWLTVRFAKTQDEQIWGPRLQSAFRLLADTGFGGRRGAGWGQTSEPEWQAGNWPGILFPKLGRNPGNGDLSQLYWFLSLYSPHASDEVNWKAGDYRVTVRGGRVESPVGSGVLKKNVRMISEGSVLSVAGQPVGAAVDVAPEGFAHPVYRSGLALALRLPVVRPVEAETPVEKTPPESSLEAARESEREPVPMPVTPSDLSDEEQPVREPEPIAGPEELTAEAELPIAEPDVRGEREDVSEPEPAIEPQVLSEPEGLTGEAELPVTEPEVPSERKEVSEPEPAIKPEVLSEPEGLTDEAGLPVVEPVVPSQPEESSEPPSSNGADPVAQEPPTHPANESERPDEL